MPVSNVPFIGEKDPIKKAQNTYASIEDSEIDAVFNSNTSKTKTITRDYIEMIIEEFSQMTQNQALFNKFLQIDTKLEKALREYQAEIKGLLNGITGANMQPAPLNQPVAMPASPQPQPINAPQMQQPSDTISSSPSIEDPKSIGVE